MMMMMMMTLVCIFVKYIEIIDTLGDNMIRYIASSEMSSHH